MRKLLAVSLFVFTASTVFAQQMTLDEWNEEAKSNIRCLPKYGNVEKTAGQRLADSNFIQKTLLSYPNKRLASDELIKLGFKYLYHDVKTAVYRFNQAYLLDSTNSDIYWGYGAAKHLIRLFAGMFHNTTMGKQIQNLLFIVKKKNDQPVNK